MNRFLVWPGILVPVFGTGIAACLVTLGVETDWGRAVKRDPSVPPMSSAKASDAALLPPFTLPGLEGGLPESADRPLFMPTRRPVPAAAAAPRMKPGQFILVGTSRTKEFGDSAMLKEIATNKTHTVKVGGAIQDMTLESIEADRAVLRLGDEKEELIMKARPQARPAGAPGAPAAPGQPPVAQQAAAPAASPGLGIFGGPPPTPASAPASALPPGAQFTPGAPGSPTVFPGAPGSAIANPAVTPNPAAATPTRAPTPEEILERRRRARAQQAQ